MLSSDFWARQRMENHSDCTETLEGNLRGVLSQLTPEEVNENKTLFAERLLEEAEVDLSRLGLTLDTLKIQNVTDERGFLDSIGRIQSAEVIRTTRISEAQSQATSTVRDANNSQNARLAEIQNQMEIVKAEADRKIQDATTRRACSYCRGTRANSSRDCSS